MSARRPLLRRMASALLAHAARTLPRQRASWAEAIEAEAKYIESDAAVLRWALGCVLASYRERIVAMDFSGRMNRVGAVAPTVMSLLALADVLVVVATGWERHLTDEGAAAHIFQLLIVGQVPFLLMYLTTAKWRLRFAATVRPIVFQFAALVLALGSVAVFRL